MPDKLASFAIHADDVQRDRRFNRAAFGWRFVGWGPPDFYLIHTGDEAHPGVQGIMHKRLTPAGVGGPNTFECSISVDDVDSMAAAVVAHGGTILMPKATIPTVGDVIYFGDPSGNRVGAVQYTHMPGT